MEKDKLKNTYQTKKKLNSENQLNQSYQRSRLMSFSVRVFVSVIANIRTALRFLMKKLTPIGKVSASLIQTIINAILQLLFIRIAKFSNKGITTGYGIIRWVIPFTGWKKAPLYLGRVKAIMLIRLKPSITDDEQAADQVVKQAKEIINQTTAIDGKQDDTR